MHRIYCCVRCKREAEDAVYIRLAVNRCGVHEARRLHIHRAFPIGHFCWECASLVLQSVTGGVLDISVLDISALDPSQRKLVCKRSPGSSLNEMAGSSTELSAGNGADRPATHTADRATGPSSVRFSAGGEKTGSFSPAFLAGEKAGDERDARTQQGLRHDSQIWHGCCDERVSPLLESEG
jgi:hypothetical protein